MSACTNETSNPLHAANYAPSVNCNVHPDSPHALTQAAVLLAIQETSNFSPASAPRRRGPLRPPPEVERRTTAPICRIMGTPASCSSKIASVRTVLRTISSLGAHSRTFAPLPACHAAGMASCERERSSSGSGRTLDDILRSQYEWAGRLCPSKPKTKTLQARHHRTVTFCPTSDSERTRCSQLD